MATRADAESFLDAMLRRFPEFPPLPGQAKADLQVVLPADGFCVEYQFVTGQRSKRESCEDPYLVPWWWNDNVPGRITDYVPWFAKGLGEVAESVGMQEHELVSDLLSSDPDRLTRAYIAIGDFYENGWLAFDDEPQPVDEEQAHQILSAAEGPSLDLAFWEVLRILPPSGDSTAAELLGLGRRLLRHRDGQLVLDVVEEADTGAIGTVDFDRLWYRVPLDQYKLAHPDTSVPVRVGIIDIKSWSGDFGWDEVWGRPDLPGWGSDRRYFDTYESLLDTLVAIFQHLDTLRTASNPAAGQLQRVRNHLLSW